MQSNEGYISPAIAKSEPVRTSLSGHAGGVVADRTMSGAKARPYSHSQHARLFNDTFMDRKVVRNKNTLGYSRHIGLCLVVQEKQFSEAGRNDVQASDLRTESECQNG